ncbi:uncharacterized protein LOC143128045 [Alosa pseudoharengus]|uniref:uncharacterized protein LOC143128045 n=1 Tax=Alosa pseudoharengus TaxID=34774 RepID=UPI003F8A827C
MTGNKSKKTNISSSPSFLDKASGFYGRLEETEVEQYDGATPEKTQQQGMTTGVGMLEKSCEQNRMKKEPGVFDFNQGMMEDDGTTTLLRRKPSRWSRRSSRKAKADKSSSEKKNQKNNQSLGTDSNTTPECDPSSETQTEGLPAVQEPEPVIVHFSIREEADDHALLRGQNCETGVKGKIKAKENQRENNGEQMKVAKRSTLKLYRKAVDRAFRRGWETFITSLYSVSLIPVTSTPASPSSGKAEKRHGSVLIDYR